MKATGIVRRIDDLGRVVIPKEIRRTMRIREGDPLEIFTNGDGGVVFKKYSLMGGLGDFSAQLCESLYKTTGKMVTITDRDACISVAGGGRRELTDKNISPALAQIMEGRQIYQHQEGSPALPVSDYTDHYVVSTAAPILSEGDVLGCVVFLCEKDHMAVGESEYKLARPSPVFWAATWRPDPLPSAVPAPGAPFGRPPQAAGAVFPGLFPPTPAYSGDTDNVGSGGTCGLILKNAPVTWPFTSLNTRQPSGVQQSSSESASRPYTRTCPSGCRPLTGLCISRSKRFWT